MSIFQKTFVFLHHLCTSGAKSAKNSSVQEPCKIKNKKQDEDITYFTTRQNEVAPLGTAAVAHPRHPYQDDSSLGSYLHLPCLSRYRSLLSPISGIFPFAVGDIFIALSIAWVTLYPIYEMGLRKKLARRFIFLAAKSGGYPKKKVVFGRVIEYLLWVYVWFYAAWGLNYSQPVIYYRVGMQPAEVSEEKFRKFAYQYADSLNLLSEERRGKREEFNCIVDEKLKNRVRDAVLKEYNKIGYREGINPPFNQHPHAKTMVFTPISSMSGVTGSMGPFFCEFTLNGDILAHDYPATYAHEFAHFLGMPTKERQISTVISSVRHHRIRR